MRILTDVLKTALYLPYGIGCATGRPLKRLVLRIVVSAYFRGKGARVASPYVSLRAELAGNVWIGDRVEIRKGVRIGAFTYVGQDSIVDSGEIGRFCSIGSRVSIGPTEHSTSTFTTHPIAIDNVRWNVNAPRSTGEPKLPPKIGNDVWIGRDAFVMRGVQIGDGAIIGANAVVTRDVPAYAIAAGVPAVVRGRRFDEDVAEELRRSQWWSHPDEIRQRLPALFAQRQRSLEAGDGCV
jgi:acetyltransferase-like isoleucine patch superfamily enzyme